MTKRFMAGTLLVALILSVAFTVWAAHKASAQIIGALTNWPTNIMTIDTNGVFTNWIVSQSASVSDKTNVTWISGLNPAYDYELGFREDGIVVWRKRP